MLIFNDLRIPAATVIPNVVVISANISTINSDISSAGRMMYSISKEGLAPERFQRIVSNGIPWMTIVVMDVALLVAVVLNYLILEQVLVLIASLAASATVRVRLIILLSHFPIHRGPSVKERNKIEFPVPLWPAGPLLTLLFMGLVIAVLGMMEGARVALLAGLVWLGPPTVVWHVWVHGTVLQAVTKR